MQWSNTVRQSGRFYSFEPKRRDRQKTAPIKWHPSIDPLQTHPNKKNKDKNIITIY